MNFHQLRAFHLVAMEGSVRRAAEVMGLSQPTLSQHLRALEERHGIRLFEKRGRGLALTDTGKELLSVTGRLMESAETVEDLLSNRFTAASGRLRVLSDSPAIAVRIVDRMLAVHPDIDISIRKDSVDGIVSALSDMRADVGIAVDAMIGSALLVMPLQQERLYVCMRSDCDLAGSGQFALGLAAGRPLIMRERTSRTRALIERALAAEGVVPGRILEIEGAEVVREAVARSLGLAFFAEAECPPDPRLRYAQVVALRGRTVFVENLIVRRDRRRVPAIKAFLEAAGQERAAFDHPPQKEPMSMSP